MTEISAMYEALDNMDDYALMANIKPIGQHKVLTDAIAELEQLRQRVQELTAERDGLLAALEQFATWGRAQHRAQSKGCHATFDMMALKDEIDLAEAAIASVKEK